MKSILMTGLAALIVAGATLTTAAPALADDHNGWRGGEHQWQGGDGDHHRDGEERRGRDGWRGDEHRDHDGDHNRQWNNNQWRGYGWGNAYGSGYGNGYRDNYRQRRTCTANRWVWDEYEGEYELRSYRYAC